MMCHDIHYQTFGIIYHLSVIHSFRYLYKWPSFYKTLLYISWYFHIVHSFLTFTNYELWNRLLLNAFNIFLPNLKLDHYVFIGEVKNQWKKTSVKESEDYNFLSSRLIESEAKWLVSKYYIFLSWYRWQNPILGITRPRVDRVKP